MTRSFDDEGGNIGNSESGKEGAIIPIFAEIESKIYILILEHTWGKEIFLTSRVHVGSNSCRERPREGRHDEAALWMPNDHFTKSGETWTVGILCFHSGKFSTGTPISIVARDN